MMKRNGKIYLNPKQTFVILSVLLGLIMVILLPTLYRILTIDNPDGLDYKSVLPDQILIDGILGALAGVAFAVFGLFRFEEAIIVRLIRLFLLIIVSLIFLSYITIKSLM